MRRVNLIPMAGEGQRFVEAGYSIPKPLIDVDGIPMVVRAANSLPDADHWIFICREEHIQDHGIDKNFELVPHIGILAGLASESRLIL